jgi:hypothetical protein
MHAFINTAYVFPVIPSCRYAAEHGVAITTFDCASELEKIARGYPSFKCVLRIRCDDASAKINLGLKYGADLCDVPMLLGMAKDLGLQVCVESGAFAAACNTHGYCVAALFWEMHICGVVEQKHSLAAGKVMLKP